MSCRREAGSGACIAVDRIATILSRQPKRDGSILCRWRLFGFPPASFFFES
jgi:hypothetical protein